MKKYFGLSLFFLFSSPLFAGISSALIHHGINLMKYRISTPIIVPIFSVGGAIIIIVGFLTYGDILIGYADTSKTLSEFISADLAPPMIAAIVLWLYATASIYVARYLIRRFLIRRAGGLKPPQ